MLFRSFAFALLDSVNSDMCLISEKCLNFPMSSLFSPKRIILSSGMPAFFAASHAVFKNDVCVTKALALASLSWNANSSEV